MTLFGIRVTDFGESDEFYVGEDDVLFDWLVADNFEIVSGGKWFFLEAPDGYAFHSGNVFPVQGYDGGRKGEFLSLDSLRVAKAQMLLVALRNVTPEEFDALNIGSDRIVNYLVH